MKPANFEQIISFENLLKAHNRACLCKQHKKEVIEFELNLSKNLWALHYDLKYHKYKIGGYHKFMIYDPKEREIQAIPYRDRTKKSEDSAKEKGWLNAKDVRAMAGL